MVGKESFSPLIPGQHCDQVAPSRRLILSAISHSSLKRNELLELVIGKNATLFLSFPSEHFNNHLQQATQIILRSFSSTSLALI